MTKEEAELIIKEQDKSTKEILKVLEKEKCELLGIIQGKDKAIKDLEWQLQEVAKDNDNYQKENAELKLKLDALEGQTPWKDIKDKSEVIGQLSTAKELLKWWVSHCGDHDLFYAEKTERFLREVEK